MGVDVEPLFRYSRCVPRLEAALPQGATVTCMVVHAKFLVRSSGRPDSAATPATSAWYADALLGERCMRCYWH